MIFTKPSVNSTTNKNNVNKTKTAIKLKTSNTLNFLPSLLLSDFSPIEAILIKYFPTKSTINFLFSLLLGNVINLIDVEVK